MLAFLLPLASKIISDAVAKLPDDEELGEKAGRDLLAHSWQGSQTN